MTERYNVESIDFSWPSNIGCWIFPTSTEVSPLWKTIKQNRYFIWQSNVQVEEREGNQTRGASLWLDLVGTFQALLDTRQPVFQISIKTAPVSVVPGDHVITIASSSSKELTLKAWEWLENILTPELEKMETAKDEWEYLVRFISASVRGAVNKISQGTDEATQDDKFRSTARTFRQLFGLPDSERLVNYYSCALDGSIRQQGWMYISEHYLGFYSFVMGVEKKTLVELRNISDIRKERSKRNLVADAIAITTSDGVNFFFGNLIVRRDEAFECLQFMVNKTLHGIMESSTCRETTPPKPDDNSPARTPNHIREEIASGSITPTLRESIESETKLRSFVAQFHLPYSQSHKILQIRADCTVWSGNRPDQVYQGQMFLSNAFLCFFSPKIECQLIIPLAMVQTLRKLPSSESAASSVVLTCLYELTIKDGKLYLGINDHIHQSDSKFDLLMWEALRANASFAEKIRQFQPSFYSERLLKGTQDIPAPETIFTLGSRFGYPGLHETAETTMLQHWKNYFAIYGSNLTMLRTPWFYHLERCAVPTGLRGELWAIMSGSIYSLLFMENDAYQSILDQPIGNSTALAVEEIEKDIHRYECSSRFALEFFRSLPEYPAYKEQIGLDSLRRVLVNYAKYDQQIGYCQAMNIVTAVLLIYLDEALAFWTLHQICKVLAPAYYSPDMHGAILDQTVFEALIKRHLPFLSWHLEKSSIQISPTTLPWFLTFFIGSIGLPYAIQILDLFFAHGIVAIMRFGLAILSDCEAEIIESINDDGALAEFIKRYCRKMGELNKERDGRKISQFEYLRNLSRELFWDVVDFYCLEKLRSEHKRKVISRISDYAKKAAIREAVDEFETAGDLPYQKIVEKTSKCYDEFLGTMQFTAQGVRFVYGLDFDGFIAFMKRIVPVFSVAQTKDSKHAMLTSSLLFFIFQKYGGKKRIGRITFSEATKMVFDLLFRPSTWIELLYGAFKDINQDALQYENLVTMIEFISGLVSSISKDTSQVKTDDLLLESMELLKSFKDGKAIGWDEFFVNFSEKKSLLPFFQSSIKL